MLPDYRRVERLVNVAGLWDVSTYREGWSWWEMLTPLPSGQQAVTDLQDWPFWPCLVKPV